MVMTLAGKTIVDSAVQFKKASIPTLLRRLPSSNTTVSRVVQLWNAFEGIALTLAGTRNFPLASTPVQLKLLIFVVVVVVVGGGAASIGRMRTRDSAAHTVPIIGPSRWNGIRFTFAIPT